LYTEDFARIKLGADTAGSDKQILLEITWPGCQRGSCVFAAESSPSVDPGKVGGNEALVLATRAFMIQ